MPRSRSLAIYGLSVVCALLFVLQFKTWPPSFVLQIETQTERYARLEFRYDQGAGFRRQDSVNGLVNGGPEFKRINFAISTPQIRNLSLLQYDGSEPLRVRHLRIKMLGRNSLEIPADRIRSGHPGTTVTQNGEVAEIRGINGNANVAIALPSIVQETRTARRSRRSIVILLGLSSLALALLALTTRREVAESPALSDPKQRLALKLTLIFLVSIYLFASVAKLNGSATALWRIFADRQAPNVGLLLGTPKDIRSDEWVGETPWILSQAARQPQFALENPGVGDGVMPLLNNLPVRHWTMLFRPQMWAFFITDVERAFAFYWNFKWFGLLLGAFLFFRAIARGNSVVALFGAFFLFFSPFIQWWFSTPTCMPEMLGAFFLALWSASVIGRAKSRWAIVGGAIVLVGSIAQFIFCAYPRFQVPLIHLALLLLAGALIAKTRAIMSEPLAMFRLFMLTLAAAITVLIILAWYHDVAGAIHRVSLLAYPGKVFSTGGGLPWQSLFTPFLEFGMTDQHYPADQMNVCEAAGFLFFAPLVAVAFVGGVARGRFDPVIVASLAFIGFALWFMLLGFPPSMARCTGFSLVYSSRVVLALSVAAIIGLCRYLADSERQGLNISLVKCFVVLIGLAFVLFAIFHGTNRQLAGFVDRRGVVAASIFFALVFAALWYRLVTVAAILVLIPAIYSTALANPVGRGLPGFTESQIFRWLSAAARQRPGAKWLVIGPASGRTNFLPQFVKAMGIDTFGGYRCEPDPQMVQALDPTGRYAAVYNRYAEILFLPSAAPEPSFELTFVNHYNVLLPLKREILDRLGVKFVLEIDMPAAEGSIEGYSSLGEREGLRLLKQDVP
jgi:hypothetical protein